MNVFIVIIELFLFFITSRFIAKALFGLFYKITRSTTVSSYLLGIVFFPGTLVHELAHWVMAKLLFVRTGELELKPEFHNNGLKLGSVQIAKTDLVRRFLIGVAPLLGGSALLLLVLFYSSKWIVFNQIFYSLNNALFFISSVYIVFVITNTMFSSKRDMEGALALLLTIILIVVIIFVAGKGVWIIWLLDYFINNFVSQSVIEKVLKLLLIPLVINLLLVGLFILVSRLRK